MAEERGTGGRDLRVQVVERGDGTRAYTIVWPDGSVHAEADRFLRTREPGTDRTYAAEQLQAPASPPIVERCLSRAHREELR